MHAIFILISIHLHCRFLAILSIHREMAKRKAKGLDFFDAYECKYLFIKY
jgi:hypothetical protein